MNDNKWQWWMVVALLIGAAYVVLGVGNLASYWWDDASLGSALIAAAGALTLTALVIGGLVLRRRGARIGSAGIAVGAFPACAALMFWWFLPAVIAGVLAVAVVVLALADAFQSRSRADDLAPATWHGGRHQ